MNGPKEFIASMIDAGLSKQEAETVATVRFDKRQKDRRHGDITMAKRDGAAEILLYEEIGFDFMTGQGWTPRRLTDELDAMKPFDRIVVRVNSPGGNAFDGLTIFNILSRQSASVAVDIEGNAASAASIIAQAADPGELSINDAGSIMIHRSQAFAMGDTNVMLKMADITSRLDDQVASIYASRSEVSASEWLAAMDVESWYFGQEAVDAKLADKTTEAKRVAACADWSPFGYQHVPERLILKPDAKAAEKVAARLKAIGECGSGSEESVVSLDVNLDAYQPCPNE